MLFTRTLHIGLLLLALAPRLHAGTEGELACRVVISVRDQKALLLQNGTKVATYPVSTSKFGLGDRWNSMSTPLGCLQVAQKIGDHAPPGAVFKNRRFTGEILEPNSPGRDPIVTRIIWLRGLERTNANTFNRCIYIHGTPEERLVGKPASYGCIRMRSKDISALYAQLPLGALVQIIPDALSSLPKSDLALPVSLVTDEAKIEAELKLPAVKARISIPRKSADLDKRPKTNLTT